MKYLFLLLLLFSLSINAQSWVEMMHDSDENFFDVQEAFNDEWENKEYEKGNGWKQFKRWEWFMEQRVYPSGNRLPAKAAFIERKEFDALYPASGQRTSNWQPMGPDDWNSISYNPGLGRVNAIYEDPNDSQTIYAGTPSGGLWKTEDGGNAWLPLTDEFSAMGISGIAVDPGNSQTIYVATGDGDGADTYSIGVLKSEDGGQTWQNTGITHNISQFITCRKILMHPNNSNVLFVATKQGLFKTTDAGDSWVQVESGSFRDIEFHPTDNNIVYASTDSFYKSVDGGDTFAQINTGLPNSGDVNRMEIAVSPDDPNRVYALCGDISNQSYLGLYRSDDSGNSFQITANSLNLFSSYEDGIGNGGQSWYDMALAVETNDADHVFVGGVNVWESFDGGDNFIINSHWVYPASHNYTHADIHTLDYYGNNLYCGSDGGIFISQNNGVDFQDLTPGMEISQFYRMGGSPQNTQLVIGGTQDNGSILRSGGVWTHVKGADGMEAAIHPANADIMFCTQQTGKLHRSTNGGNSWSFIFDGDGENGGWVTPYQVLANDDVIAGYENVWRSNDNGNSFTQISNFTGGETIRDLEIAPNDINTIYICFSDAVYRTINNGANWVDITNNLPNLVVTDMAIHPENRDIVWVTTSGYSLGKKVYVTTDGGNSWQNISLNLPNLPANAIVFQEGSDGGIYVGMDVGVFYTDSTLGNWQSYDSGLPNVIVSELEIHYSSNQIKAATHGRGIWYSDLYTPSNLLPEADFSTSSTSMICETDSIYFTDASIYASPNWAWYFPGGNPATSQLSNPGVLYSSQGNYTASLVVSNANGTDSIAKPVTVSFGDEVLSINITTDGYSNETSWTVTDENNNTIASGGVYAQNNTLYQEMLCLVPGCYEFTISDSYGDGICCSFGMGSYDVELNGDLIASGGEFDFSEITPFCIDEDSSLVLNEEKLSSQFKIFPNPASDVVQIIPNEVNKNYSVKIYDTSGKLIHESNTNTGSYEIKVNSFQSGIYSLQILTDGNQLQFYKIQVVR